MKKHSLIRDLIFPARPIDCLAKDMHQTLLNHLKPQVNELAEITKFSTLIRSSEESYTDFILRLQQQAAKCNFGDQLKIQLRNRLVAGINNKEIQKKFLAESKLTYDSAKKILETTYNVEQAALSTSMNETLKPILYSKRPPTRVIRNKEKNFYPNNLSKHRQSQQFNACYSCGGRHHRNSCKF